MAIARTLMKLKRDKKMRMNNYSNLKKKLKNTKNKINRKYNQIKTYIKIRLILS